MKPRSDLVKDIVAAIEDLIDAKVIASVANASVYSVAAQATLGRRHALRGLLHEMAECFESEEEERNA